MPSVAFRTVVEWHKDLGTAPRPFPGKRGQPREKTGRQIATFDWVIKTILCDKTNFDVLKGFLTALFKRPPCTLR